MLKVLLPILVCLGIVMLVLHLENGAEDRAHNANFREVQSQCVALKNKFAQEAWEHPSDTGNKLTNEGTLYAAGCIIRGTREAAWWDKLSNSRTDTDDSKAVRLMPSVPMSRVRDQ